VHAERIEQNFCILELSEDVMERIAQIQTRHRYISPAKFWKVKIFADEVEPVLDR
jgi:diketogulonate reductase-like aldo/keto reductase